MKLSNVCFPVLTTLGLSAAFLYDFENLGWLSSESSTTLP